jgi:hypothetical protein
MYDVNYNVHILLCEYCEAPKRLSNTNEMIILIYVMDSVGIVAPKDSKPIWHIIITELHYMVHGPCNVGIVKP